jgi:hypothetical protein
MPHAYVVLADRVVGFDTLEDARRLLEAFAPSVLCRRESDPNGNSVLVEILRHDWLYDEERGEWRMMIA